MQHGTSKAFYSLQLCKSFAEETVVCSQLTEFATSALDAIAKRGEESCRKLIIAGGFNALSWFTMSANDGLPEPSEMTEDDYSRVSPDAMTSALAMCTCASKGTLPWWFLAKVGVVLPLIVVARFTEELSLPFFRGSRWRGMWDDSNLAEGDCHPPLHPMSRRELARVTRGLQEEAIGYLSELAARMPDLYEEVMVPYGGLPEVQPLPEEEEDKIFKGHRSMFNEVNWRNIHSWQRALDS